MLTHSERREAARPRDLLLRGYAEGLTDAGLLSIIVGEQAADSIERLLSGNGVSTGLWSLSGEELVSIDGVGPAGAARVLACREMGRRVGSARHDERPSVSTPEDVVRLCGPKLAGLDREHFSVLALNTKNRLIRMYEVSVGSLNATIVHPRELFKEAVRVSAASVVVVHNHPSGDPAPSGADIQLTRRLVKAGDVLGIEVLDHVVIGDGGEHASLRDLGLM
jgi:DNA repair protein RadC